MRGPFLVLLFSMYALGQAVVTADGPVHFLCLGALRDGMQDCEYFWLLRRKVAQLRERGREAAGVVREAAVVIDWPKDDEAWLARLRARPEAVLAVRRAAAEAIERADHLLGT